MDLQYREIGQPLLGAARLALTEGRTVVLMGGRDVGKRYVIHRLSQALKEGDGLIVVTLELDMPPPIDAEMVRRRAVEAVIAATVDDPSTFQATQGDDLLGSWTSYSLTRSQRLVCLVANVDSLPQTVAMQLLDELREGVECGAFSLLMSGEAHLPALLEQAGAFDRTPLSFVIQGFDQESFQEFVEGRNKLSPEEIRELHYQTGGRLHLLRQVLWVVEEAQIRHHARRQSDFELAKFFRSEDLIEHLRLYGLDLFPGAIRRLASDVSNRSLDQLTQLLDSPDVIQGNESGASVQAEFVEPDNAPGGPVADSDLPSELELIGLAKRDPKSRVLCWSSRLARRFANHYLTPRRRAHLCAIRRDWQGAREYFRQFPREEQGAIFCDGEVFAELTQVVDAYCTEFHRLCAPISVAGLSGHSQEEISIWLMNVHALLEDVLRFVLGFDEVIFARRIYTRPWELCLGLGAKTGNGSASMPAISMLQEQSKPGVFAKAEWIGVILQEPRAIQKSDPACRPPCPLELEDEERSAVFIHLRSNYLRPEQTHLVQHVFQQYEIAHRQLAEQLAQKEQLKARANFVHIVGQIFHQLYRQPTDAVTIVNQAAKLLKNYFPYKRVLFSLVDTRGRFIKGEALDFVAEATPPVDLKLHTKYWLKGRVEDVQVRCVLDCRPFRIRDAAKLGNREVPINEKLVADAKVRGFVVLPILRDPGLVCLGTIHIERLDDTLPTLAEQADLLAFAERLGTVLEQSQRMNLLMCALDAIPAPIAILDAREHLHFANALGADMLKLGPDSWHFAESDRAITEPCEDFNSKLQNDVLEEGRRCSFFLPSDAVTGRAEQRLHAVPFTWRQHRGGALLYSQALEGQYVMAKSAEGLMNARRDRAAFLQFLAPALGYLFVRAGRLYRKYPWDQSTPAAQELRPLDAFDLDDPDRVAKFCALSEDLSFPDDIKAQKESWKCFFHPDGRPSQAGQAIVMGYFPKLEEKEYVTSLGLRFRNILNPLFNQDPSQLVRNPERHKLDSFRKPEGAIWVDVPLYYYVRRERHIFGKLTLDCGPEFGPEQFAILSAIARVLSEMVCDLQTMFFLDCAELDADKQLKVTLEQAREQMHSRITSLSEMISPLAILVGSCKRQTESHPELQPLAVGLEKIYESLRNQIVQISKVSSDQLDRYSSANGSAYERLRRQIVGNFPT